MNNDGLETGGEGSDIGEDLYDNVNGFGTQFMSTTSALLDIGADGIQHPRLKSRRTASMPTPAITNFLTTGLNSVPHHSSPLSMYSTTGNEAAANPAGLLGTSAATAAAVAVAAVAAVAVAAVLFRDGSVGFVGDGAVKDVPSASALEVLFFAVLALLAYPVLPSFSENIGTLPISLRFSPTACLVC